MILSILIATVPERAELFQQLYYEFLNQIGDKPVEIIYHSAPRGEMSIGQKRQELLNEAKGNYIVYFDDDDFPKLDYVGEILKALETKPDCVGFKIAMTTNGKNHQTCIHSLSNKKWYTKNNVHYRNCTHFNPIKREIALSVGFPNLRWGEDEPYSNAVSAICKTEYFIDKFLFDYRYSNIEEHSKKYGFQK